MENKDPNSDHEMKLSIKNWAEDDRPREKLINKGCKSLSDAELLSILIGSGSTQETALDLSKRILKTGGNGLSGLAKYSIKDLMRFKGIGAAKAVSIAAAMEIGRRRKTMERDKPHQDQISCSSDAYDILLPLYFDLQHEEFWILLLNKANKVIAWKNISVGGVSGTYADPKIIYKLAVDHLASSIILSHNHPSGSLSPSNQDRLLTGKLKEAGALMDINVVDHLIISDTGYFSFADNGIL